VVFSFRVQCSSPCSSRCWSRRLGVCAQINPAWRCALAKTIAWVEGSAHGVARIVLAWRSALATPISKLLRSNARVVNVAMLLNVDFARVSSARKNDFFFFFFFFFFFSVDNARPQAHTSVLRGQYRIVVWMFFVAVTKTIADPIPHLMAQCVDQPTAAATNRSFARAARALQTYFRRRLPFVAPQWTLLAMPKNDARAAAALALGILCAMV
jgi:hypothetical protein